jgi:PKD-like domain
MFYSKYQALWPVYIAIFVLSCSHADKITGPIISINVPIDGFKVEVGKSIPITPLIVNDNHSSYTWTLNGNVVSLDKILNFNPSKIGNYDIQLKVSNQIGSDFKTISIKAFSNFSPYITKVFDYKYGPGQHASIISADWNGSDFIGQPWTGSKIYTSLGGWGGYIIAGFDHPINNTTGKDFGVFTQPGPGSEPAVISVMSDVNNDGIPNDGDWLEIKGSEYSNPETIHNYQVTYLKPTINGNVTWNDNLGHHGELIPGFGSTSWWWSGYGAKAEVVFTGEKLPNAYQNTSNNSGQENWALRAGLFSFGYGECYSNLDYNAALKANLFDLSDCVDKNGHLVTVTNISFIKVQSGVFQIAGWLNEISTEVSGAVDLSLIDYPAN